MVSFGPCQPIEHALKASPHIVEAVVFGSGRPQCGALIVLAEGLDVSQPSAKLFELIKSAVSAANASAPSHSRLSPESLVFLPHDATIPRADKGSFIR